MVSSTQRVFAVGFQIVTILQLDSRLWSPLHAAAASGSLEAAKELIKWGADVGLITCENAAAVHLCNDERLRVFMMWSIVLKEAGATALVDAINVVRKCGYPPVPVKLHQAKSRYADKVVARKVEWEVCSSVDAKSLPSDMHPLHAAVICSSVHVIDILIRSLSNVLQLLCNASHAL
jgi:ankyrin repeat protein